MKRRKVLAMKNKPTTLNLAFYGVVWLLMDRFDAAPWLWGVVGTVCAILLACAVADMFTQEQVELWGDKPPAA